MTAAIAVHDLDGWFGSIDWRYFGPRPLVEDNSIRSQSTTVTNLRIGRRIDKRYGITFDVFNLFDRAGSDVDYFYLSRIAPSAASVDDIHSHPIDKRALRVTVTAYW